MYRHFKKVRTVQTKILLTYLLLRTPWKLPIQEIVFILFKIQKYFYTLQLLIGFTCFHFVAGDNSQLDDLYTRYRQRLRRSLFESGLITAFIACCFSLLFCIQVSHLLYVEKIENILNKIFI